MTWQEFLDLPERYHRASLIDGELYANTPSFLHQLVVGRLYRALMDWANGGQRRGIVSFEPPVQITNNRGYKPDLAW